MDRLEAFTKRLSSGIRDAEYRKELEDEIVDHLVCKVVDLMAQGMAEGEAVGRVIQEFGHPESIGQLFPPRGDDIMASITARAKYGALAAGCFLLVNFVVSLGWWLPSGYLGRIPLIGWLRYA